MTTELSKEVYNKALTDLSKINSDIVTHINNDHVGKSVGFPLSTCHRCGNLLQLKTTTTRIIDRFESCSNNLSGNLD